MRLIQRLTLSLSARWYRLIAGPYFRAMGVRVGLTPTLYGFPIISISSSSSIVIGDRSVLCSDSRFTALGINHPVVLRTMRPGAEIRIGHDVGMSGTTICAAQDVEIGDLTLIGANVTIVDTDFHALDPEGRRYCSDESRIRCAPVSVGRTVFIGAGSIILKGVTIGANSVIGAGSVVSADIPPNSIAAGNPCRVLRQLRCGLKDYAVGARS